MMALRRRGGAVPAASSLTIGFSLDGARCSRAVCSAARCSYADAIRSTLSVNSALFPDVYSYNFDAVNI